MEKLISDEYIQVQLKEGRFYGTIEKFVVMEQFKGIPLDDVAFIITGMHQGDDSLSITFNILDTEDGNVIMNHIMNGGFVRPQIHLAPSVFDPFMVTDADKMHHISLLLLTDNNFPLFKHPDKVGHKGSY
jgi:hypothetical protein